MLKNISIGQYYPGNSAVHRMDPRVKILLAIAYIVAVFIAGGWTPYIACFGFVLLAAGIAKIPYGYLLRSLKPILFIVAFTFILNIFFTRTGTPLFEWGIILITVEGVMTALRLAIRLVFLVLGTSLLTLTTSPIAMTDGLEYLMKPLTVVKFPAHELAMMMTIAMRFIPTLLDETDKIMKAQMARGADFESGNLIHRAKAMIPLLVPLFVSAFRRAEELAMAMEARCYHGGEGRTRMKVLRMGAVDAYGALVTLVLLVGCIFLP